MSPRRTMLHAALVIAALAVPSFVAAQTYPTHPVRLVIPFAPGGSNDVFGRVIATQLTERLGQSVYVDNRAGAGGVVGTDVVAKSAADGYTLLLISSAHAVNASLVRNLPYDPVKSFTPIALLGHGPGVLCVNPGVPATSVKELLDLAKQKPGQLNAGAAGIGSFQHMSTELFKLLSGADIVIVQYKGGGPSMADLLAGHVQLVIGSMIQMMPHVKSGALRALATTGPTRNKALPNVPTIAEAGVPGYEATNWWGIVAPAGTPDAIVKKLHDEATTVVASAEMRQRLGKEGAEPVTMSTAEFARYIEEETARWAKVVKSANISLD